MHGISTPKENAERIRSLLQGAGLLDSRYHIAQGERLTMPIREMPGPELGDRISALGGGLVEMDFRSREVQDTPFEIISKRLGQARELDALLPRRWELLGDVLVLNLGAALMPDRMRIAEAYADVLGARAVVLDRGREGEMREQSVEVLLGDSTETVHLENGVRYKMDVAKVMFSSGNIDERVRVSKIRMDGEIVADMFAGIGYFSLPAAMYCGPAKVVSYEINPVAHKYLRENAELNGVADVLQPNLCDNREAEEGIADRVIMGYIKTTHEFLPKAMRILKSEGGIVHYHETCPNELLWDRPVDRVAGAASDRGFHEEVLERRVIKSYAPGVSHVVLDVRLSR